MEKPKPYIEKELSWLSFNERVLQEAEDEQVPLIERVRFLGIFSNNLDEFFRVRVADARRLATFSSGQEREGYEKLLVQIRQSVKRLQQHFDKLNTQLMKELARRKIYLINESQLKPEQAAFVTRYFNEEVLPDLSPILVTESSEIPQIDDSSIYLGVKLHLENGKRFAIVNIPTELQPRFVRIPSLKGKRKKVLIVLENVIRQCLADIFRGTLPIVKAESYVFKITRDAELELGEGITQSLMDKVATSLKRRKHGAPVRFVYDRDMPEDLLDILSRRLGFTTHDRLNAGGRYHNSKDFMDFPNLGPKYLEYKKLTPLNISRIDRNSNLFASIREQDILLNYPYHSYRYIENLLLTAAIDPNVRSIKITLYRMARNSHIVNALTNAARNDKEVTAIVELQARFDEQANIDSARQLTEAGVNVIFGVPGLKVHSKLILITCQEGNTRKHYTHIGTGNFNEKTARVYTDLSLLTYDQEIGEEVSNVFQFLQFNHLHFEYRHLFVSPHTTRSGIVNLIDREIDAASRGKKAEIFLKCNNLVDNQLIDRLYKASQVGVKIKLIVRGMCSLVPGVKGVSENIEAVSIVDRFLEHSRIYVFHNGGKPKVYISSADLMTRNLDYRVEVSCPIYDEEAKKHLLAILDLQWRDRAKARIIDGELTNNYRLRGNKRKLRSQVAIYEYWKKQ